MRSLVVSILAVAVSASTAFAGAGSCAADINGDNIVDVQDLVQVVVDWGCAGDCASDINSDGIVDVQDLIAVISDWGCEVAQGPVTTVSGFVTNAMTGDPLVGASVFVGADELVTNASGAYSGTFPVGLYDLTVEATNFISEMQSIVLFPDVPLTVNFSLEPVAPVIVSIQLSGSAVPGGALMATAIVEVLDGSTIEEYAWMQTGGLDAMIDGADMNPATVNLPTGTDYKTHLFEILAEPPIGPDQLPPNVPVPPGEFPGGLQDRFEVVGLNPFALEETGLLDLEVEVTTSSGVYSAETAKNTVLPWRPAAGIRNVPINIPVILHGKTQASYDWSMTRPTQSSAMLMDASTQNPEFTPDFPGKYTLTVTDLEAGSPVTLEIFAGNWRGVIIGQDGDGRPISDTSCTGCHSNLNVDNFAQWKNTGHAEIFTDQLNTSTHWGPQCFACHSVGYDPQATNNGIDEQSDYQSFLTSGLINVPSMNNWTMTLASFPATAKQANVQCENCHGPQWGLAGVNTLAHGPAGAAGEPRISLSSDMCATCHGEPLRHARFQQWQLSGHANYELAIDEGESGACSRCHTVNGFLTWLPILLGEAPGDPTDDITVTWTADETHPQTCVTCHDPHSTGTTSGVPTNATVRISDNTPPLIAGFTAYGVGRGAICMTCHNSRRGLRNDTNFDEIAGTSETTRAPHGSAQTDVLMGENAYLVTPGIRGNHSFLTDTCVKCHMEETPPPADLAYNLSGTNHTFYAATSICSQCHEGIDAEFIQGGVQGTLDVLQATIEDSVLNLFGELISQGNFIDLDGEVQVTNVNQVQEIVFGESRGRQAITVTVDNVDYGPIGINNIDVVNSMTMVVQGPLYNFADPSLPKAGWNYNLVNNDSSLGVHNPSYAYLVLTNSISALSPTAAAQIELPWWFDTARLDRGK